MTGSMKTDLRQLAYAIQMMRNAKKERIKRGDWSLRDERLLQQAEGEFERATGETLNDTLRQVQNNKT